MTAQTAETTAAPVVCTRRVTSTWTTCRCDDCRAQYRRLQKRSENGAYTRVPSARAWVRLDELIALGWTAGAVASVVPGMTVRTAENVFAEVAQGHRRRFGAYLAHAITTATAAPTAGRIGAVGTRRRLEALAAAGYGHQEVNAETGIHVQTVTRIRSGVNVAVTPRVAAAVAAMYGARAYSTGPNRHAARQAAQRGYAPAMAWDDDTIDDPAAQPVGVAGARQAARAATVEDVTELAAAGGTVASVCARLGKAPKSLEKTLQRAGRHDLWARLRANETGSAVATAEGVPA